MPGQIDIKFNINDALDKAALASKEILDYAEKTVAAYEKIGASTSSDALSKMAKQQESILITSEKLRQEQEKTQQQEIKTQEVEEKRARLAADAARKQIELEKRQQELEEKKKKQLEEEQGIVGKLLKQRKDYDRQIKSAKTVEEITKSKQAYREVDAQIKTLTKDTKSLSEDTRGFGEAATSFQFKFNFLGNLLADAFQKATSSVKQFITSSVDAFYTQEASDKRLLRSLNGNLIAFDRLKQKASEIQGLTIFGDEEIEQQMAFLAAQGRNEKQILNTINAAVRMSDVLGMDLNSAMRNLDKTLSGSVGELGEIDIAFKSLTVEQLKSGGAIDLINKKYADFGNAITSHDYVTQFNNTWGDTKEVIGSIVAQLTESFLPTITTVLGEANSLLGDKTIPLWEKYNTMIGGMSVAAYKNYNKSLDEYIQKLIEISKYGTSAQRNQAILILKTYEQSDATGMISRAIENADNALEQHTGTMINFASSALKATKEINKNTDSTDKNTRSHSTDKNTRSQMARMSVLAPTYERDYEREAKQIEKEVHEVEMLLDAFEKTNDIEGVAIQNMQKREEVLQPASYETRNLSNSTSSLFQMLTTGASLGEILKTYLEQVNSIKATSSLFQMLTTGASLDEILKTSLGIDDEQVNSIKATFNDLLSQYTFFIDSKIALYDAEKEAATTRINELTSMLNAEIQLNQQGYSSNIQLRMNEIEEQERIRNQAIADEEKYAKRKALIEQISQISSTVTAVANTFKTWSEVPFVGIGIATAQVAAMLLSIASAKNQAKATAKLYKGEIGIGLPLGVKDGIDTIPAMLTRGESVVDRLGTEMYPSGLRAILAHQAPEFVISAIMRDSKTSSSNSDSLLMDIRNNTKLNKKIIIDYKNNRSIVIDGNITQYIS